MEFRSMEVNRVDMCHFQAFLKMLALYFIFSLPNRLENGDKLALEVTYWRELLHQPWTVDLEEEYDH